MDVSPKDAESFVSWWGHRTTEDLDWMLQALAATGDTVDGQVCRLRASQETDVALRRSGRVRLAGSAAHRATVAALSACSACGLLERDRDGATRLVRAAADAARTLVAGECTACTEVVLRPFFGPTVLSPT